MKKRLSLLAATLLLLAGAPYAQAKISEAPVLSILNHHNQEKIHGRSIRLVLRITPSPDRHHPIHLHVYVNGKMATMVSISSAKKVLTLHHLPKGKDVISFVQANPVTHKEMGDDMAGMDMGDMSGMDDTNKGSGKMGTGKAIEKKITVTVQ